MATINVSSTESEPTHHLKLTPAVGDPVGLIAVIASGKGDYTTDIRGLRIEPANQLSFRTTTSQGTQYSSFERPYSYCEQVTWNNGIGELYAPQTPTGYYAGRNLWTMNSGQMMPAGIPTYGQGYRSQDFSMPDATSGNCVTWTATHTNCYWAESFVASATYTAAKVYVLLRKVGSPSGGCTLTLHVDSGGIPGTQVTNATSTLTSANITTDYLSVWAKFPFSSTVSLTASTTYWVKLSFSATPDTTNYWLVGANSGTGGLYDQAAVDGWTAGNAIYFRSTDADVKRKWHFFEYKRLLYAATEPEDGSAAPQLFRNGWRGVADSNSGDKSKLYDSTQTGWTTAKCAGSVAVVYKGAGASDNPNYRTITTAASGELENPTDWNTTHVATTTEYIVHNSDWWTEIASHGMTTPVKGIAAPGDVIYFAQGDADPIRRGGEYNNAGAWTARTWADDGTNYADLLGTRTDQRDGVQIIRGLNKDSADHVSVSRASIKEWGSDLQFGTQIPLGEDKHPITGMADGEEYTIVVTEAAVYAIDRDSMDKIIDFGGFAGPEAGLGICYSSPFVYFSLGRGGFERLQDRNMEDIGLWRLEGWGSSVQGPISSAVAHPQHTYAVVDAGSSGYSTVYAYNGGWHEIYRAPEAGQRIRSLFLEVIEGSACNRLWIGHDADIVWVPLPNVLNPFLDSNFKFHYEYAMVSSWMDEQARDMLKYFKELKVFTQNLSATNYIEIDYQTDQSDDSSAWTRFTDNIDTSPADTLATALTCKRWRYRIRGYSASQSSPARFLSSVVGSVTNIPPKYNVEITWQIIEEEGSGQDLNGDDDGQTYSGILASLLSWASSPTPVTVASVDGDIDGRSMFVMPSPRRPVYVVTGETSIHVGTLRLQEA